LGPGWRGVLLLARAAAYAGHPENYSVLFDIRSMEPLVAGPPFVRALEELVDAAQYGPDSPLEQTPGSARRAFWSGWAGMALSWPSAAAEDFEDAADPRLRVGFARLPGAREVYNVARDRWDERDARQSPCVPLLSVAGRVGVVRKDGSHPTAAFQLLLWLSGNRWSTSVCSESPAVTLFRREHLAKPKQWVEPPVSAEAAAGYASITQASLTDRRFVTALTIPGRSEYLAALDRAVQTAVDGTSTAQEALQTAAASWQEITKRLGVDQQKSAYRSSLGLE
jgi:multiple sugar transport system substrate-binding protein